MSKIINSGGFLGDLLGKVAVLLMKFGVPLTKNVLAPLATMAPAPAIDDAIQSKMRGSGARVVRAGKGITLFILDEDMDDITRIIKLLENSDVLINKVNKTVKHEIKNQEGRFLGALIAPFAASMLGCALTGGGVGLMVVFQEVIYRE